jgi:hypothetical protein
MGEGANWQTIFARKGSKKGLLKMMSLLSVISNHPLSHAKDIDKEQLIVHEDRREQKLSSSSIDQAPPRREWCWDTLFSDNTSITVFRDISDVRLQSSLHSADQLLDVEEPTIIRLRSETNSQFACVLKKKSQFACSSQR